MDEKIKLKKESTKFIFKWDIHGRRHKEIDDGQSNSPYKSSPCKSDNGSNIGSVNLSRKINFIKFNSL